MINDNEMTPNHFFSSIYLLSGAKGGNSCQFI